MASFGITPSKFGFLLLAADISVYSYCAKQDCDRADGDLGLVRLSASSALTSLTVYWTVFSVGALNPPGSAVHRERAAAAR